MFSFLTNLLKKGQEAPENISAQHRAYNESRHTKNLSAICYAPSVNMYFSQDGNVRLCCHNMEYSIGKYPEQSIQEIWNSDAAKKFRRDMEEYKLYDGCNTCRSIIDMGAFEESSSRYFDSFPIDKSRPTMMEFLLTNTCNLECIMCQGEYSSLIRQNREKLPPIKNVYDDSFIEQLREYIPHLREARFSGSGEAFLIDANYKIWEMIIELNPKCAIVVQTNGMVLNARVKDFLKRGNFKLGVSIDSLQKETFETIRPNARLERVMENIQYFSEYSKAKNQGFSVALCVMRQNWRELPDFVKYANSLAVSAKFHKVYQPIEHSLQTLPKNELEEIVAYLNNATFETDTALRRQNKKHFQYILDSIKEWLKIATINQFDHLSDEDLYSGILKNANVFCEQNSESQEQARQDYLIFQSKLHELIERYSNTDLKRKILTQLYRNDLSKIYPMFRQLPIDELAALTEKYLPSIA